MKSFIFFISLLFVAIGFAQDEEFKATLKLNPSQIQTNETFEVIVEANTNGTVDIEFPNEISVLNRTKQIQSSGGNWTVIVNGKPVNSGKTETTYVFKYIARASKKGTYLIKNASYKHSKGVIELNPLTIQISEAPPVSNSVKSNLGKPFFGIINTSRSEVYVGEPVIISSKVYSRGRITDVGDYQPLSIEGIAHKTDLFKNLDNLQVKNEKIEGIGFQTMKISEDLVIPQEAGEINCTPFSIQLGYQGNFFFTDYTRIQSGSARIKVRPLPSGAPKGFSGAVGDFKATTRLEANDLKEGDVFVYTVRLEGKGNIHLLRTPELNLPEAFEQYGDPVKKENVSLGYQGGEGSIEYEFTIQAQEGGEYDWHPMYFSYFNPKEKRYVSIEIPKEKLSIKKSEFEAVADGSVQRDVQVKGKGLRYISDAPSLKDDHFLVETIIFWMLIILIPFVAVGSGVILKKRRDNGDEIAAAGLSKRASKLAQRELAKAQELWIKGDVKSFADEGLRALQAYLAKKMKCAPSELSKESIEAAFSAHSISEKDRSEWFAILEKLELIKYTSFSTDKEENLPDRMRSIITNLDQSWS